MRPSSLLTFCTACLAWVCGAVAAQQIYSCVDARGRTLSADRPIPECIDRTQRELTSSGLVKRQLGPTLTAHEQAVHDETAKRAAEVHAREAEEKRRDKALLLRYPNRAAHEHERAAALLQIDEGIKASRKRQDELADQRKVINGELEFYLNDPSKAPASLKRRREENDSSVALQQKFINKQEQEKKRVNLRFDEELAKLGKLWVLVAGPLVTPGAGGGRTVKN